MGEALTIVKPETLIRWHRKGFRLLVEANSEDVIVFKELRCQFTVYGHVRFESELFSNRVFYMRGGAIEFISWSKKIVL